MPRSTIVHVLFAALSLTALLAPIALPGCHFCNDDVCESRLVIAVREPAGAALRPGVWDFELVVDGVIHEASCEIGPNSRSADCDADGIAVSPIIFHDPDNPYTLFQILVASGEDESALPAFVDVTIVHDGDVVVDETLAPSYELEEPEHCDADCVADHIDLTTARGG